MVQQALNMRMLKSNGFGEDICLAGGLHSIYGTSVYKSVLHEISDERRENVRKIFSFRVERLVYLFHICNRPRDLNNGQLYNRYTNEIISNISEQDIYDLCCIEGANFIDQKYLDDLRNNFPRIYCIWYSTCASNRRLNALQIRKIYTKDSNFKSTSTCMVKKHMLKSPLAVGYFIPHTVCVHIQSIPLTHIISPSISTSTSINHAKLHLIHNLRSQGFAIIKIPKEYINIINKAYISIISMFENISIQEKKTFFLKFDRQRYVGYTQDIGREWLQLRSEYRRRSNDNNCFNSENEISSDINNNTNNNNNNVIWPVITKLDEDLYNRLEEAQKVSTELWDVIATQYLGYSNTYTHSILNDTNNNTTTSSNINYGSSVHRIFVYKDKLPSKDIKKNATKLLHPYTQEIMYPENNLQEDEWLLFTGETLSYMTGGIFRAPLHRVPFVDCNNCVSSTTATVGLEQQSQPQKRRCSMPFFLRAAPNALLRPRTMNNCPKNTITSSVRSANNFTTVCNNMRMRNSDDVCNNDDIVNNCNSISSYYYVNEDSCVFSPSTEVPPMSCRRLMESHIVGDRPWRLQRGGDF
eukprot:gene12460-26210_t